MLPFWGLLCLQVRKVVPRELLVQQNSFTWQQENKSMLQEGPNLKLGTEWNASIPSYNGLSDVTFDNAEAA